MRRKAIEWAEIPPSPWQGVRFVDSHLHLEPKPGGELALALADGTLLFSCGVDRKTSARGLRLAADYPETVKAFVGVHPSEVLKERELSWVGRSLSKATGLGEVGLDPKYSGIGPRSAQMRAFIGQLRTAERAQKPIQVHSRDAERECLDVLSSFRLKSVLMHWLQSEKALPEAMSRGYFVSFGPSMVYSKKLQRMAAQSDRSLVLTETDSPVPFGPLGGAHGPSLVPSVVFSLAGSWGTGFEEARATTAQNAMRYLGIPEKA